MERRAVAMAMDEDISSTAALILARVRNAPSALDVARLAKETGLSLRDLNDAVHELLVNRYARLTPLGTLLGVDRPVPELAGQPPLARVALIQASREDWRFQQALREPAAAVDGVPVYGAAAVRGTLAGLHLSRPREVLSLSPPAMYAAVRPADRGAHEANMSMLSGGTRSGWVLDDSRMRTPWQREPVLELARAGEQVATAPRVSVRMSVYDRQLAIVPIRAQGRGCSDG